MREQQPICIDDFGEAVYCCRYTGVPVWAHEAVAIGARIPGVHARQYMAPSEEARQAREDEGRAFHENEAN